MQVADGGSLITLRGDRHGRVVPAAERAPTARTARLCTAEHQETQYTHHTDRPNTHFQRGSAKREWGARAVRPLPTTAAPRCDGRAGEALSATSGEPSDRNQAAPGACQLAPELAWPTLGQGRPGRGVQGHRASRMRKMNVFVPPTRATSAPPPLHRSDLYPVS